MSTVIKAGQAGPLLKHLCTVDLADHLSEARAIIAGARRQAARILADAGREAEVDFTRARESGFEEGLQRGLEAGRKAGYESAHTEAMADFRTRQGRVVESMQQAVEQIEHMKDGLRNQAERDLLDFSVQVASKLTFAIGRTHREAAIANLRRALEPVAARTNVTIHVHPVDRKSIETFADDVLRTAEASRSVRIVEDAALAPGGCKVRSGQTEVNASLETQVAEMVALLGGGSVNNE